MTMRPPSSGRPQHIISVEGLPGSGKTDLAVRFPGKVAVASTDGRYLDVMKKRFAEEWVDRFLVGHYYADVDFSADVMMNSYSPHADQEQAKKLAAGQAERILTKMWKPFVADHKAACADPTVSTIVWDQADELYEYLRLANFGKLEKNPQMAYGPVNGEYRQLIQNAKMTGKNLVLIHQVKKLYRPDPVVPSKSIETKEYRRRGGPESVGYLIDSFIRCHYPLDRDQAVGARGQALDVGAWQVEVILAKKNPVANGVVLPSPEFEDLMGLLDPETDPVAWGM